MLHHRNFKYYEDADVVTAIRLGDVLKVITKVNDAFICYEFDTYSASGQYSYRREYMSLDNVGTIDSNKINFGGVEVHAPNTMFTDATIYGNHAWNCYQVVFTAPHGLNYSNIGKLGTLSGDSKTYLVVRIDSSTGITVIGTPPAPTTYTNASMNTLTSPTDVGKTLTIDGSAYTISTITLASWYETIKHTHDIFTENGDTMTKISADGSYSGSNIHVYNYASTYHLKTLYAYVLAKVGTFSANPVLADFFPNPGTTLKPIQDRVDHYTIYPDSTMICDTSFLTNTGNDGVDSPYIIGFSMLDCKLDSSRMYFPKILKNSDPDTDDYPSRCMPTTARDYNAFTALVLANHDTDSISNQSLCDRIVILDDARTYGIVNGLLPVNDMRRWKRYAYTNDYSRIASQQANNGKIGVGWNMRSDKSVLTVTSYKKYLQNPNPDVYSAYYTIRYGNDVYLFVDFHSSFSGNIVFPSEFIGYDCELIENTSSITLGSYSTVDEVGVSASYTYSAGNPYASCCYRIWKEQSYALDYCVESLAYFERAGSMTERTMRAIDTFIKTLKTYQIWSQLDCLWLMGHESEALSIINLISSSYSLTKSIAAGGSYPTFTALQGWTGSTTGYLNTNYNPYSGTLKYTQNSASMGVFCRNGVASDYCMGTYGGSGASTLTPYRNSGTAIASYPNLKTELAYTQIAGDGKGYGFFTMNVSSATTQEIYKNCYNDTPINTLAGTTIALNNATLWLLGRNAAGYNAGQTISMAFIGASLTGVQNTAFYWAIRTLLESINVI